MKNVNMLILEILLIKNLMQYNIYIKYIHNAENSRKHQLKYLKFLKKSVKVHKNMEFKGT